MTASLAPSVASAPGSQTAEGEPLGLRPDALGLAESTIMGVAGSGPAYSVAASTVGLIGVVGVFGPACLLYAALIMFGVVFAFARLNKGDVNSGASYAWVGKIFSPALGFLAGWSSLISSVVFMVSGTLPAAAVTLKLIAPGLSSSQVAVTSVAALWLVAIGAVVAKGVKLTSYTQIALTLVEAGVLTLFIILAIVRFSSAPAHPITLAWLSGAGSTPSALAGGAMIALFALSGWDVTANLNEETRDGARLVGAGSILALALVAFLLAGFYGVALLVFTDAQIAHAGLNIVPAIADRLLPRPWSSIGALAVMLSTIGTLETSMLQFTRTMFSMARDGAVHPRYARLHRTYRTPLEATLLIVGLGLVLLFLSSWLPGVKTVIDDSINAVALQIAFYYGLAGFACAYAYRRAAMRSFGEFILLLAWPLLGAALCVLLAASSLGGFDLTTNIVGLGGIAVGVVPYLWSRRRARPPQVA
ncbi:MAG TPA: APC family permease [Beijerinckiaceae bacterium]|nr:APC family permease [Beijerinckiaceae bacterium]